MVLLTATFLAGALAGGLVVFMACRLVPRGVAEAGKRARKPRPPRCYVVEPTDFEQKPKRPRTLKHPPSEDEASGSVVPDKGVDLAV